MLNQTLDLLIQILQPLLIDYPEIATELTNYLLKDKIPFLGKSVDAISDLRQENPDLLPQIPEGGLYKEKTIGMPAIANTEKSIKPTLRSYISPEKANMYDDIAGLLLAATGLGGATALSKARLKPKSRFF
jgi:hypothetical protein